MDMGVEPQGGVGRKVISSCVGNYSKPRVLKEPVRATGSSEADSPYPLNFIAIKFERSFFQSFRLGGPFTFMYKIF